MKPILIGIALLFPLTSVTLAADDKTASNSQGDVALVIEAPGPLDARLVASNGWAVEGQEDQ